MRWALRLLAGTLLLAVAPTPGRGQAVEESRLLRDAASRESRGDFAGAERVLRGLLEETPVSSGGLFALERVLRAQGRPAALLPVVDAFLYHDPAAGGVRQLKLRLLLELDSVSALDQEAERWFQAQPVSERAYREVAALFERAFGPQRALTVLERGRKAVGHPATLALEMGDLLVALGRTGPALDEWALAVGEDGAQAGTVARRVAGLPGDARSAAQALVTTLGRAPEVGRRRAAVQIALEMRLADSALTLARQGASGMEERQRAAFLADVARRARDAGMGEVAAWAYGELGQGAGSPAERRQFDQRLVEISLSAGDTAAALEAQRRVTASFPEGALERRRSQAVELRLQVALSTPDELRGLLAAFRSAFPDAPEADGIAAHLAGALLARGDLTGAAAVLEGVTGPATSLQRAYLLLAQGRPDEGSQALLESLPGLEASQATGVIQLVSLLGRVSPETRGVLARAAVLAHGGRGLDAAALIAGAVDGVSAEERPAVLAQGARMADADGPTEEGATLRERLLLEHPAAAEAPDAALALARHRALAPGGEEEAIRLLEELVSRAPGSAVAPDARRELERLKRGGP